MGPAKELLKVINNAKQTSTVTLFLYLYIKIIISENIVILIYFVIQDAIYYIVQPDGTLQFTESKENQLNKANVDVLNCNKSSSQNFTLNELDGSNAISNNKNKRKDLSNASDSDE